MGILLLLRTSRGLPQSTTWWSDPQLVQTRHTRHHNYSLRRRHNMNLHLCRTVTNSDTNQAPPTTTSTTAAGFVAGVPFIHHQSSSIRSVEVPPLLYLY